MEQIDLVVWGWKGQPLVPWLGGPPDASFGFYLREAFESQTNTEKILQQESLGTDMLQKLKNSNYTRYHTELINGSCGGWFVSTLL